MTRVRVGFSALLAGSALALAACGGSSHPRPAPGTAGNPLQASVSQPQVDVADATGQGTPGQVRGAKQRARADRSHPLRPQAGDAGPSGEPSAGAAAAGGEPAYEKLVEHQSRHPQSRFSPCNLVTASQAGAILGRPVQQPVEAPQGPTCLYRPRSGRRMVAVAVQRLDFGKVKPLLRGSHTVTVAHRTGFCGTYGQSILYVPLSSGRVLSISAPCRVAKGFATRALPHL